MPRTTLRNYLSTPNPQFRKLQNAEQDLSTTDTPGWDPIEGKEQWHDFALDQIDSILGLLLDHEFELPEQPPVLPAQLEIRDERSFESVLLGYNCIIVNAALKATCEYLRLPQITWLVGSYARAATDKGRIYPDWAGIGAKDSGNNLLPGDSKFAQRAFSLGDLEDHTEDDSDDAMMDETSSEESLVQDRWTRASEKCLEQVNHYAGCYNSRYCYLVSPIEVLLGRRRMDEVLSPSRSLAKNRPTRPSTAASQPQRGESAPLSSSPSALSSSPGYTDHGHPDTNMKPIELCAIRWEAQGMGVITFNLALWAFHMVSAIENKVEANYPVMGVDPAYQIFASRYHSMSRDG